MERIIKLLDQGFVSSTKTTAEFKSFARKFKNDFQKQLDKIDAKITFYNTGHFYVSGFFRFNESGTCYYFSISDVRFFNDKKLLYRTAKDEKDFTGGMNQYVNLSDNMAKEMVFHYLHLK